MRHSPLDAVHRRSGARLVEFGGWELPLEFSGTIEEHLACRRDAVVFDVSHLGSVRLAGPESFDLLQNTLANDLAKIGPGKAQYTHLLDADGSVLDDIIVWWHPDEAGRFCFDVLPNASNTASVIDALGGADTTDQRALLAVQGPAARDRLASVFPQAAEVGRYRVATCTWSGVTCTVAGTGYTGEAGVEIAVPLDAAVRLWEAIVGAGIVPAGLGARDTLRLESGLPLHGHELGPGITPLQAGLERFVAFDKPTFRGRDALVAERDRGVARRLCGIATDGRRPPRSGCRLLVDGVDVGEVTSGNFSPMLGHGIALAFGPPDLAIGTSVSVDVRGTSLPGTVVAIPFV